MAEFGLQWAFTIDKRR